MQVFASVFCLLMAGFAWMAAYAMSAASRGASVLLGLLGGISVAFGVAALVWQP